ncbi:MAG: RNA methyltransferase [Desulfobacteraceae bacterium]|nr:RNA methyltransferase [Desulfobacteraceae bacterium]
MKTVEISSPSNDTFSTFLKLTKVRGIKKHRMALLSGLRQTEEVLKEFPDSCSGVVFSEDQSPPSAAETGNIPCYSLSRELFRQLDLFGTDHPVLIVKFRIFPLFPDAEGSPGCTLCIPFQDPANVGSMIRAAAGLGVSRVVLLKEAAHPFHPKSVRVAGSNIFRVPIFEGPPLKQLATSGTPLITLSPRGEDIAGYQFPSSFCLVPGLEGPGIPASLERATALAIPMKNGVESLNAAMATGIVLYLWQRGLDSRNHSLIA